MRCEWCRQGGSNTKECQKIARLVSVGPRSRSFSMKIQAKNWLRKLTVSTFIAVAASSCTQAATDFNQVGKQISILLQNAHFSRSEFSDKMSNQFLDTYFSKIDPSKIFFTQEDIDLLRNKYGTELDDYLMSGEGMDPAAAFYSLFSKRVAQRIAYATELLKNEDFQFNRKGHVARSRRKVDWPKNEAEMKSVWKDMVEEQLLSEGLRRETIAKLAKEQGKPDPSASEKSPKEKLMMRYARVLRNIQESSDEEDVADALLSAVALTYDPHTEYMSARETDRFKDMMKGSLTGIGALLGQEDDGATKITGIVVGGPADKCGELKLNDRIVGVDANNTGEMLDILYMKMDKVVDLVRGKEGSTVRLKVEPAATPGQAKIISLKRSLVELKDELAKGRIIDVRQADGKDVKLGILSLPSFYADMDGGDRRCAKDVKRILERMAKEHVQGVVIDLRNNGGGSLEEVREMTGFFTGKGPVVQIKDSRGGLATKSSYDRTPLFNGKIVVLANKLSASASEILAAALQDYGKAVIVGDQSTFGKGTVQQPVDIGNFLPYFTDRSRVGILKVTTQKFYRVAGGSTQLKGVESDIVLPSPSAAFDVGEATLDHAMPYDQIPAAKNYKKSGWIASVLPALKANSEKRVAADKDLQIMKEDIDRMRKRIDENKLSINIDERRKENEDLLKLRKDINAERKVRFAQMVKDDAQKYKIYRLTLEDAEKSELPLADPEKDNEEFMKMAEDPTAELDDSPDYPSGLDPELREALNIVADMVDMGKTARK